MTSTIRADLTRWLQAPPITGWLALPLGIVAVGIPTLVRLAIEGVVTGCEFTPYLPFVFIAAILLRWWQAGAVALTSVAILGGLFGGSAAFQLPCFMSAAGIFLMASAIMIGVAVLMRRAIAALQVRDADDSFGGFVFSLDKGEVWASWRGEGPPLRLGSQRRVTEMMEDFLASAKSGKPSD